MPHVRPRSSLTLALALLVPAIVALACADDGDDAGAAPGPCVRGQACVCDRDCDQRCDADGCGFYCDVGSSCHFDCPQGGCAIACMAQSDCAVDCPGGSCEMTCEASASCRVESCDEGKCTVACLGSDECTNACGLELGCITVP
jgi:hypothetical protein